MSGKDERPYTDTDLFIEELRKLVKFGYLLFEEYPYMKKNKDG